MATASSIGYTLVLSFEFEIGSLCQVTNNYFNVERYVKRVEVEQSERLIGFRRNWRVSFINDGTADGRGRFVRFGGARTRYRRSIIGIQALIKVEKHLYGRFTDPNQ